MTDVDEGEDTGHSDQDRAMTHFDPYDSGDAGEWKWDTIADSSIYFFDIVLVLDAPCLWVHVYLVDIVCFELSGGTSLVEGAIVLT